MGADSSTIKLPNPSEIPLEDRKRCLGQLDLSGIIELIKSKQNSSDSCKIAVMVGAGISVSAGIPDFRSPTTGLYSQLQKYNLPTPESVFTLDYFRENPTPFCTLALEMLPGRHRPTKSHAFLRLLQDKGLLLRCYTQNIDTLERVAGVTKLVEAHGSFADVSCIEKGCGAQFRLNEYRELLEAKSVPRCGRVLCIPPPDPPPTQQDLVAALAEVEQKQLEKLQARMTFEMHEMVNAGLALKKAEDTVEKLGSAMAEYPALHAAWEAAPKTRVCHGLVKSSIVFFGEPVQLPGADELQQADLLIIMGTSLQVMPFAGLVGRVGALCPRLLINRELVGLEGSDLPLFFPPEAGLRVDQQDNYRDVFASGECDQIVEQLCEGLGWNGDLNLIEEMLDRREPVEAWSDLVRNQPLGESLSKFTTA